MSDICVVCCVEAGPLEVGARRLVESLRRFGGELAQAQVLAVTPRFGPSLTSETRSWFSRLQVEHVRLPGREYSWNNFMNKPAALEYAANQTQAEVVVWLDSDVLLLNDPKELIDFGRKGLAACAPDKNLGSTGPDDPHDAYWIQVCRAVGLDVHALPMIQTEKEKAWVRLYVNSGVFAFPRLSGLAQAFGRDCRNVLQAGVSSRQAGIFFTDQVVLGVSAVHQGLSFEQLSHEYNYAVGGSDLSSLQDAFLAQVNVLHYHDAMWPWAWPELMHVLGRHHPRVAEWMEPLGPVHNPLGWSGKALAKTLKIYRQHRSRRFQSRCTVY